MPEVCVGLGSNLGDRAAHLRQAVVALSRSIEIERLSSVWLTEPVGLREQPAFYNAVLTGRSDLAPGDLLEVMIGIEAEMGRRREIPMGPRTIDLDLLVYDDSEMSTPELVLPHPRMAARRFVLAPLVEIAPTLRIARDGRTASEILAGLAEGDRVERLDLTGWPPEL